MAAPGRLLHGAGDAAQDVNVLLRGPGAVEELLQAGHELFGRGRVEKAHGDERLLQMGQHGRHLRGIGLIGQAGGGPHGKGACKRCLAKARQQRLPPVVGDELRGGGQVERAVGRIGRNAQAGMAAPHIRVAHAIALAAKQKSHAPGAAGRGPRRIEQLAEVLARRADRGIGDTIRVSLTPQPGEARTQEVLVASEILQAMGLRAFVPSVSACPGCGRTTSTTFQELAKDIDDYLRAQMPVWRDLYPGVERLKVAVMGCIVNGPGESKHADIGISLPGNGESPAAPVFIDGEKAMTLRGDHIAQDFQRIVEDYIAARFGNGNPAAAKAA